MVNYIYSDNDLPELDKSFNEGNFIDVINSCYLGVALQYSDIIDFNVQDKDEQVSEYNDFGDDY